MDASLHVDRAGDAVASLNLHVTRRLAVRVQVDESGSNYLARHVDHFIPG